MKENGSDVDDKISDKIENKTTCLYYLENGCRHGDNCRNLHPRDLTKENKAKKTHSSKIPCIYFKRGYCRYGNRCHFLHERRDDAVHKMERQNEEEYEENSYVPDPSARNRELNGNETEMYRIPNHMKDSDVKMMMQKVSEQTRLTNDRIYFLEEAVRKMIYR